MISKNDIYIQKATLCKKSTEQTREIEEGNKKTGKIQKKKEKKKKKTKQQKNYKRERAKKRGEGITSRESLNLRPIKKSSTKRCKYLITGTIQILKSLSISFLPKTPEYAQHNSIPDLR